jgi:fido (protein-threonine AMPylation protein)
MKLRRSVVRRQVHAVPTLKFEQQSLTSFSGLVLFQRLFAILNLTSRLRTCFRHLAPGKVFGPATLFLQLVVHLLLGFRNLRDARVYRDDPLVQRLLGLHRLPDVATLSRMLRNADPKSVEIVRRLLRELIFERLVSLGLSRLTLDFDGSVQSTRRHAEGTAVGYNKKRKGARLAVSEATIRRLHKLIRGEIWDAGWYKDKDGDIIERSADGRRRVRFKPVPAKQTPAAMKRLMAAWTECLRERCVHPLAAMAAFDLDFLCIHPFRDGNGRVSRLLLLLQCCHLGIEVGRYISLERLIEQNKERYYETLKQCSRGWHEAKHDPWPFINHMLFILKEAYKEFEERVGQTGEPKGAKTELVLSAMARMDGPFSVADLQRESPGVGLDLIRKVLKQQRSTGKVKCLGLGRSALWQRTRAQKA